MDSEERDNDIKMLKNAMFGNGKPENSVLSRLSNIEKTTKTIKNLGWVIICGIVAISIKEASTWVHVAPPQATGLITPDASWHRPSRDTGIEP